MKRRIALSSCTAAAAVLALGQSVAFAGGFEYPGAGSEAMGRGGAFTAKADDATAFDYNLAGFAKQRGTRLMFDSNLVFNTLSFARAGSYPDLASDVPYGGAAFPKVHNSAGPGYVPFIGVSTDFGYFDRWTFAFGLFAPNSVSSRNYGTTVTLPNGTSGPSPARYDITKINTLVAYPSLSAAVRATHWLDIGVAVELVYASLDLGNASLVYISGGPNGLCKSVEAAACDGITDIKTSTVTVTGALGLMFHPSNNIDIGVNVRPQINIDTTGKAYATAPPALSQVAITPGYAEFHLKMPTVVRLGIRYAFKGADHFEHGDIEVDGDYENWKNAEGNGDKVKIPDLEPLHDLDPTITHHYQDTASVRVGGAYNLRLPAGVLTFRAGFFFDSAATKYKDTRIDFDTMAKYAPTVGLGYSVRGVTLNVAYAYIWEPDRNVTNGDIRLINGIDGGATTLSTGGIPTDVINNGKYHASNQMLSVGITIAWEALLGRHRRVIHWQ
jgi:long-subunit fatty acid transport protein